MTNRINVYYPSSISDRKYSVRSLQEGQELPNNCFYTIEEAVNLQLQREQKALEHYNKHKQEAFEKLDKLESDIKTLLKSSNAWLYFTYEGDSHGIHSECLELSIKIEGNEYTRTLEL